MAQSSLTVTPPNPTPPTNFGVGYANTTDIAGSTRPPNIAFAATVWNDPWHPGVTNVTHPTANNPSGVMVSTVPPYLEDGVPQDATHMSINDDIPAVSRALFLAPNSGAASEGAGTEASSWGASNGTTIAGAYAASVLVTGVASTYQPTGQTPAWAEGAPGGPTILTSDLGNFTGVSNPPNQQHASSLSPLVNPTLTTATPSTASGAGNATVTATGTGFTKQSVIWVNGIAYPTTFVSATSLTASAPKKATAGTLPVYVVTGGAVVTATQNWTFT